MKTHISRLAAPALALALLASPLTPQARRQTPDPCKDTSHLDQRGLNRCAAQDMNSAEQKMERLLKRLGIAPDSPEQKAWVAYRDAQIAALYPPNEDVRDYGTVYPMCMALLRKTLAESRIRDLEALTNAEGDVCSGYPPIDRKRD
jgi:uncharacterized protein YecT (DUF1311 family)